MQINSINSFFKSLTSLLCLGLIFFAQIGCSSNIETSNTAAATTNNKQTNKSPININLDKGQIFSYIVAISAEGNDADTARKQYYSQALPLAAEYGFKREGVTFQVSGTVVGEHKPQYIVTGSWPDLESFRGFEYHPQWPALRNLRPKIWEDIRFHRAILTEPLNLTIHPDKYYTLAVAWFDPNNPGDYKKYLDGLEKELNAVGGRFLYKMYNPLTETMDSSFQGPNQITLVEWNTESGLNKLISSETYKKHAPLARSGTTKFEFHRLNPVIQ